jgi:N-sulfoglucosamine sulfohydrolase
MDSTRGVLLIIADDWSPMARCYGNDVVKTPAIDAVAERGCTFDRAYCVSPSCAASRANVLTGLYPHAHGQYGHCHSIHGFRTHEHVTSLPKHLGQHDIRSALIGKNHVAPDAVYPFDFSERESLSATGIGDTLGRFLDEAPGAFFSMYAPLYPHRFDDPSGWGLEFHLEDFDDPSVDPADVIVPKFLPDNDATRRDLAGYYKGIARFDRCVGAGVEAVRAAGREDDTLVLVLSDHGMPFPGAKASSFDAGHRCPLIVSAPGGAGGVRSDALVNWCDLLPTCCDWLGIDPPDGLTGRSILPLLDGRHHDGWDDTFFSHCFHEVVNYYPYRVLQERRYKYVQNLAWQLPTPIPSDLFRSPTWQTILREGIEQMGDRPTERFLHQSAEALYDLQADPCETNNLIDDPSQASRVKSMRQRTMAWRETTADPWLELDVQLGRVSQNTSIPS